MRAPSCSHPGAMVKNAPCEQRRQAPQHSEKKTRVHAAYEHVVFQNPEVGNAVPWIGDTGWKRVDPHSFPAEPHHDLHVEIHALADAALTPDGAGDFERIHAK